MIVVADSSPLISLARIGQWRVWHDDGLPDSYVVVFELGNSLGGGGC